MEEKKFFEFYVAGVQHHYLHTILKEVEEGDTVTLLPEPTNKFDKNAIKLIYESPLSDEGVMIGYVPKKISAEVLAFITTGGAKLCTVIKFSPEEKQWNQLKVRIEDDPIDDPLYLADDITVLDNDEEYPMYGWFNEED